MVAFLLWPQFVWGGEVPVPTRPQTPAVVEFRQRVFSRENGLPDNRVLSLLQSHDGYLWVGTASGVARYDGLRFTVFGPDTYPEFVNDECLALAEGPDGSIWIGTEDGLLRLRGKTIQRFTEADGLVNKRITSLCAARNGDVWIGTMNGLNRLRRGRMESFLPAADAKQEERAVQGLYEDASGAVWMVFDYIKRWDPSTDQLHQMWKDLPDSVATITGDRQTNVWFKGSGLYHWRQGNWSHLFHLDSNAALAHTRDGSLWLDRDVGDKTRHAYDERGMFRYRDGRLEYYEKADGLSDNRVTALLEDRQGNLWIGTYAGGLNCWQPRRFPTISEAEGLADEKVRTLAPTRNGGIWIGTEGGISQWRDGRIKPSVIWDRLVDERIRALHETADGRLWVCTGDGLEVWDGFQFTRHRWLIKPSGDKYRAVTSDRESVVWVGGESGLMRWQNGQWRQFTTAEGLPHNDVYVMCEDPAGRVWLGTYGGGVCWWSGGNTNLLTLNLTHGLSHDEVRALHADAEGFLWVGTERGLNCVDLRGSGTGILPVISGAGVPPARPKPHGPDARATTPPPVPPVHSFTRRDGLYDDLVSEILEDDSGNLWITCSRGIYRVSKRELHELAAAGAQITQSARSEQSSAHQAGENAGAPGLHCIVYDEGDGLLSTDISGQKSRPAGCKTPDGRLWFPNAKGVVCVDPRRVIEGDIPPPVVIEHFLVDGEDCAGKDFSPAAGGSVRRSAPAVAPDNSRRTRSAAPNLDVPLPEGGTPNTPIALAPGRARALEIQYTAPIFRAPERVRFRYRLAGLEKDWVDAGTRRVALYTNLKPGAYRFQVQAASNVGLWNETGDSVAFSIAPHFYETAWFWPVLILAALGLVGLVVEWRLREVRRMDELAQQAALARERDRIARDMHDDLGAGLTRLVLLGDRAKARTADAEVRTALHRLTGEADTLVDQLSDLIWCSNPDFDTLDNLVAHLREHGGKFLGDAGLAVRFTQADDPPALRVSGHFRRQVLLIFKEALNNVVRHARATEVCISLRTPSPARAGEAALELEVADNGCGFDTTTVNSGGGHGLANLRNRAAALPGRLEIKSAPGQGTTTRITLPLAPHLKGEGLSGE